MDYKILIVDDEAANLRMLERLFRNQYKVISALSGTEALDLLREHDVALIISDQRMPVMTGIEFLRRAAEMRPHVVRIILTGYTDVNALVEAINSGVVYKYATKPWVNEDLLQTVNRAMQHYETLKSQHELKLQNERLKQHLKTSRESFVRVFVEMLNIKNQKVHRHGYRTGHYAVAIGEHYNLEEEELEQLSLAGLLHEFAYISIPNDVGLQTATLAERENWMVRQNVEWGLSLLSTVPDFEDVASIIRYQHEHWDGSGSPENLCGEQIPLQSRILAVANAFDEMLTADSKGMSLPHDEALIKLQLDAGKKFDPEVVRVFSELKSARQIHYIIPESETRFAN